MRYLIRFSYDGTNFSGFQKQPFRRCVETEFEKALFNINNHKDTKFIGAGRTDRGVHALGQTGSFDLDVSITLYKLKCALNSLLPPDIHVFDVEIADENFHARFNAKRKTYKYVLNIGEYNPLERNIVYQYCKNLDIDSMKDGIKYFIGKHNFKNFVSNDVIKESFEREIYEATIEENDKKIIFKFVGNGFMKYQVRNMVGTLVKIGKGKFDPSMIKNILEDERYKKYVTTIKPEGLYLVSVDY